MPEPPIPETTRPMMNMGEFTARAQIKEPASKMRKKPRNVHCKKLDGIISLNFICGNYLDIEICVKLAGKRLQSRTETVSVIHLKNLRVPFLT